ncbi:hypothetical protein L6272_00755 [Microgenomates group bacterium]|nr:hypothetical protein [Microgenomates group bacterium]
MTAEALAVLAKPATIEWDNQEQPYEQWLDNLVSPNQSSGVCLKGFEVEAAAYVGFGEAVPDCVIERLKGSNALRMLEGWNNVPADKRKLIKDLTLSIYFMSLITDRGMKFQSTEELQSLLNLTVPARMAQMCLVREGVKNRA